MTTWFVKNNAIIATPSDSNDGKDAIGFNLSGATYDDTGNAEGERHLSSTGAFSSYTFNAGDLIALTGGAGITTGLYEIASKVDDDAILLVNSAGSDSSGDVTSSDGPFATINHSVNSGGSGNTLLAAGDDIRLCADAIYTGTITHDTVQGGGGNLILIEGRDARGVSPAQVHLQSTGNTVWDADNGGYTIYRNIWFDGNGNDINTPHAFVTDFGRGTSNSFIGCKFSNSGGPAGGIQSAGPGAAVIHCEITGCNRSPMTVGNQASVVFGCRIHNNKGNYWSSVIKFTSNSSHGCKAVANLIYNNGEPGGAAGNAIETNSNSVEAPLIAENIIYNNRGDGILFNSDSTTDHARPQIYGNSLVSNGGYGINFAGLARPVVVCDWNHFHNNVSGVSDLGGISAIPGRANITGPPLFKDPANGDFTPQSGSALLNGGIDASDL